jgi:hypothetical protein
MIGNRDLCHCSSGRFRNHLFHSIRNCFAVRRNPERGGPDHAGPLRKHPIRPRNKPGSPTLPVDITWIASR